MYLRVREAKYRIEIVTFIWDFLDHINPGDTILGTPTTEVIVSSGFDSDPSEMILGPALVSNGTIVSQRIRKGVPGTIYTVSITINTVQGDTFEDFAYLAILPLPSFFFKYFLETALYPIEMYYEGLQSHIYLTGGKIFDSVIMVPEGIVSTLTLTSGTLFGGPIGYTMTTLDPSGFNGNEAIISDIYLINGILFGGGLSYTMTVLSPTNGNEAITSSIYLIDGTLFGNPLNYTMTPEGITSEITLINGILA